MRSRTASLVLMSVAALAVGVRSSAEIVPLTDNDTDDTNPRIDGSKVVWQGDGGGDEEIFLFDGETTVPLTDNAEDDIHPDVSGDRVVWQGFDGDDFEIVLYDGGIATPLTDDHLDYYRLDDRWPAIDGTHVVWTHDVVPPGPASSTNVGQHYNGVTTTSFGSYLAGGRMGISDSNYAWVVTYNVPYETFVTGMGKVSGDDFALHPAISGSTVVWDGFSDATGTDYEIFLYEGGIRTPLTNNGANDTYPAISGANVAWQGWDGHDWEIWFFNGVTAWQITHNETNDERPDVSGFDVVWEGNDGNDREIYRTTVPEPTLLACGVGALLALAAVQRRAGRRDPVR